MIRGDDDLEVHVREAAHNTTDGRKRHTEDQGYRAVAVRSKGRTDVSRPRAQRPVAGARETLASTSPAEPVRRPAGNRRRPASGRAPERRGCRRPWTDRPAARRGG